jgi:hypothetical protein
MRCKIVGPAYVAQYYEVNQKKKKKVSILHYSIDSLFSHILQIGD